MPGRCSCGSRLSGSGKRALLGEALTDDRAPERIVHPFGELLLKDLILRAQGWTDHSYATLLRHDPLPRLAVSLRRRQAPIPETQGRRAPNGLASKPTQSRFLGTLAEERNRESGGRALPALAKGRLGRVEGRHSAEAIADMDSLPIEVHGHQPVSA